MQRPARTTRGQSSQNFDDFDDNLMKRAYDLQWMFVKKGDLHPIVIPYNHSMWPTDMTTRQKVNLEKAPPKTKVNLMYENKEIECSLTCVMHKSVISHAVTLVHQKMRDADGQLSDVSYNGSQPSPSPARSVLKRPSDSLVKPTKAKKSIKFSSLVEPSISLNEHLEDSVQKSETSSMGSCCLDGVSDKLFELVDGKFRQLIAIQEDHARKISHENSRLRGMFAELLKKQKGEDALQPVIDSSDPLMFGNFDLMKLTPLGGAMSFGRLLAATLFGADEKCELINQRLDVRITKNNCRKPADPKKESLFKECVARFYPNGTERALKDAIRGANQFGTDLKTKYAQPNGAENRDPNADSD